MRAKPLSALVVVLLTCIVACALLVAASLPDAVPVEAASRMEGPPPSEGPEACTPPPHSGTISANQTWCASDNPHLITGSITVNAGVTLTVDPGVLVKINAGQAINLHGALVAVGNSGQPITLTPSAADPASGRWQRIMVYSDGALNLDYCDVAYSGTANAAIEIESSNVQIRNSTIHHSPNTGILLERAGIAPVFDDSTIADNAGYAILQSYIDMTPTYTNLTLTGNGTDAVVVASGTLGRDVTLDSVAGLNGKPFILTQGASIPHGFTLTLQPGTLAKMGGGQAINVYGTLSALGSAGKPIMITPDAADPASGRWQRIMVYSDGAVNLDHADIGYSGTANAAIEIQSSAVQIRNSTIHHSGHDGISLQTGGIAPVFENTAISDNARSAIYQSTIDMTPTYTNLTLAGNGTDAVVIAAPTLGRDVTLDSVAGLNGKPFILTQGASIPYGFMLTLQPGTLAKMGAGTAINVYGTLSALGSAEQPITLTPDAADPASGPWQRIMVYSDGALNLDHCDVAYSGTANAAIEVQSSAVQIRNSTIHHSGHDGISLQTGGIAPVFENTAISDNARSAIYQSTIDMTPTYTNLTLAGNGTDAVVIAAPTLGRDVTLDSVAGLNGKPFILTQGASIPYGFMLTLQPGTLAKMGAGAAINVHGTLSALGSAGQPITLTPSAADPASGRWQRIMVYSDGAVNLDHCDVAYSGTANAAIEIESSNVRIRDSAIHHSASRGIRVGQSTRPVLSYNRIYANATGGLLNWTPATPVDARNHWWGDASGPYHPTLNPAGQGQAVSDGVLFSPWLGEYAWLAPAAPIVHGDVTLAWAALAASPGAMTADIRAIGAAAAYTLGTGLPSDSALVWPTAGVPDGVYELRADFMQGPGNLAGTASRIIAVNNAGSIAWHSGLISASETWAADRLHVVDGDIRIAPAVTVTISAGTVVKFAPGTGIVVGSGAALHADATSSAHTVLTSLAEDSAGGDTNLDGGQTTPMPGSWRGVETEGTGHFDLNAYVELRYVEARRSGTLSGSATWPANFVNVITGDVTVPSGATLTIQPGAIVKFEMGRSLVVQSGATLNAPGAVAEPVVFTSIRDDSVGGDTNRDGNLTSPAPGDWYRIYINGGAATLDHVQLRYGAGTSNVTGAMLASDGAASLHVSNSTFESGQYTGLLAWGGTANVSNSVFYDTDRGLSAHPGSTVQVTNCTVDDNRVGLLLHGGSLNVANTLVSRNLEFGILRDTGADALAIRYSDVWNPGAVNYSGTADRTGTNDNISVDPVYRDAGKRDYRLNYGSPAIDAADGAIAPATDFMGAPRYDDPRTPNTGTAPFPDIGAYEFVETAPSNIDLVVTAVEGPLSAVAGETVAVSWSVTNLGPAGGAAVPDAASPEADAYTAVGPWHDALYLASGGLEIEAGEFLVGQDVSLGPGQSATFSAQARVPGAATGNYRWQARANVRGEVFEGQNAANNAGLSAALVALDLPELAIGGAPASRTFVGAGQFHWFKLRPQAGQDIRLFLDLQGVGATELYLAQGYVPDRQHYDLRQREWNAPDVHLYLPGAASQSYYLTAYAASLPAPTGFTLSASAATFDLESVSPSAAGNQGQVTFALHGGGLEEETTYEIVEPGGAPRAPVAVFRVDSILVYATFDLNGLPAGAYDVCAKEGPTQSCLTDAVQVSTGTPGRVETSLIVPRGFRVGRSRQVTIEYRNVGDTDAPAPLMRLNADNLLFYKDTPDDVAWAMGQLYSYQHLAFHSGYVLGISREGPAGVLPPGASGSITLNAIPSIDHSGTAAFSLDTIDDLNRPNDLAAMKAALKPNYLDDDAWNAVWANAAPQIGATAGQFHAMLIENANYLSSLGEYEDDAMRLTVFELMQSNLPAITKRYQLGAFGRGGTHPWDVWGEWGNPQGGDTGIVYIHYPDGRVRAMYRRPRLVCPVLPARATVAAATAPASGCGDAPTYDGAPGDYGILVGDGWGVPGWTLTEANGMVYRFEQDPGSYYHFRLAYVEDREDSRLTLTYAGSRVTAVTHTNGDVVSLAYNAQGRISQVTDAVGRVTTYAYDAAGEHLTSVSSILGTIGFTYYSGTNPARKHSVEEIAYPGGTHLIFQYDEMGRTTRIARDGGAEAIDFAYQHAGPITVTDALGNGAKLYVNAAGQAARTVDPSGITLQATFDAYRNLIALIGPQGFSLGFTRGLLGAVEEVRGPLGTRTRRSADVYTGSTLTFVNELGATTQQFRDAFNNVTQIVYQDTTGKLMEYNARGRVTSYMNARGETIVYTYDGAGLLTRKDYPGGGYVEYGYNARRLLTSARNMDGSTTSFQYDSADRMTRIDYPGGRYLIFTYDAGGRRASMTDQTGFKVIYGYDAAGRLQTLKNASSQTLVTYQTNGAGRLARVDNANGSYTTFEYNPSGQIQHQVTYGPGATILARYDYTHDALGRTVGMTTVEGDWSYGYDLEGRLTTVSGPGGHTLAYVYDAAGNRTSVVDNGSATAYTPNLMDQYTAVGAATFTYDKDGNLKTKQQGSQTWSYSYDAEDRLIAMTTPQGTWTYEYDALGHRVASVHDGQRTEYLIDPFSGGSIVGEFAAGGDAIAHYVQGHGLAARVDGGGAAAYYAFDGSANTALITGAGGAVLNRYGYLPYGEMLSRSEAVANPFTFVGQFGVVDGGEGLYFMRNRWYDPQLGRFTQPDPLGAFIGGGNLYRYAGSSPVQLVDPQGLAEQVTSVQWEPFWYLLAGSPGEDMFGQSLPLSTQLGWLSGPPTLFDVVDLGLSVAPQTQAYWGPANWGAMVVTGGGPGTPEFQEASETFSIIGEGAADAGIVWGTWVSGGNLGVGTAVGSVMQVFATPFAMIGYTIHNSPALDGFNQNMTDVCYYAFYDDMAQDPQWGPTALKHLQKGYSGIWEAVDPNEKQTVGVGVEGYIARGTPIEYTVYFENLETATAPAQRVTVADQLDAGLDLSTFEILSYGFGPYDFAVPSGRQDYETGFALAGDPYSMQVQAKLNPATRTLTWVIESFDPVTGDLPEDPLAGFLPPNDENGSGQGYVAFRAYPLGDLSHGAVIHNQASIVFDVNAPIATNTVTNTLDSQPPASQVQALPPVSPRNFTVRWSGTDSGSGVGLYDIFVSDNGGSFNLWQAGTEGTQALYAGVTGHTYRFYSVAVDRVGLREAPPASPDAETTAGAGGAATYLPLVMRQ